MNSEAEKRKKGLVMLKDVLQLQCRFAQTEKKKKRR